MYYLTSILFGLIPEVLYLNLFIINIKELKDKKVILFILSSIIYFACMLIQQYSIIYYVLFIFLNYFILKMIYKDKIQIIDIFIISISHFWMALLASISFVFLNKDLSNYYHLFILDRILLFLPILFKKYLIKYYKKYCKLWNRNDKENRPIKSITLRNISLILLNSFIFILDIVISNIVKFIK